MVQQRKTGQNTAADASRYLGYGLTWAASTALFALAGRWLDGRLGTEPWLTLVGTFVGAGAGFWYMYYHLVIEPRERARKDQ
jgi:F0F1-type ATP synthase assembly protein I